MGSAFEEGCKRDGTETSEQRSEGRGEKEWTAAVAMAALSGNVGDSVALPAGAADLCFLPATS